MADFKRKDVHTLALQLADMIDTMRGEMAGQDATIQRQVAEIEQLRAKLTQADQRLDRALEQMDIARDNAAWWRNLYNRLLTRTVTADD